MNDNIKTSQRKMAFYDFEIVGMLKGSGLGASETVAELTSLDASGCREMLDVRRGDLMLECFLMLEYSVTIP